ncbi:MAG: glycosyltransferase family 4 protein [Anaerolineales bacterium]|nr:glycosyltransferase family 4 protein [Anaerolineales bacterium]
MQSTVGKPTGIGQYAANLLAALHAVAPQYEFADLNWGRDVPMRLDNRLRWQQVHVPWHAHRASADLLHVPGFDAPAWKPCPVVLTCHDLIGCIFPQNLPPVSRFYWSKWQPWSLRFADAILADSEATKRDIIRIAQVNAAKITVTPLGVDPVFRPAPPAAQAACRIRYSLPEKFILYVGTLEPRKGIDTLIDAFAQLASRMPDLHLVLGGKKGWYWEPLIQRIDAVGLAHRIHVTGYIDAVDLPALYSASAAFAFPSRYEGFGLPILEAMACGAPVVSSNTSSLPEVTGDAGLQVPPDHPPLLAAALELVLTQPVLRTTLQTAGLDRAAEFTWERTARITCKVYDDVIRNVTSSVRPIR